MNKKNDLKNLFVPKSIVIIGASEEEGKVGQVITKNILSLGFQGNVFLVNPHHEKLFSRKCYKAAAEIEAPIDLAIVVIPAIFVNQAVKEVADKVKNFVVISAGFSEIGQEGKKREQELKKIAEENQLNVIGPNCLGFIVSDENLNASFAGGMPLPGNISFVSQSGALAVAFMDIAKKDKLGFSKIISVGNKMQIDESQLLEYLGNDKATKVIGMYLEGIKNGKEFAAVAQKISKRKPIVILKAGKTEKSQKAIASHTGALAGSDDVMNALFEKTGVIRADNLEEFFNLLKLISFLNVPSNEQVAVVTNAGGVGVLTTDSFKNRLVKLLEFSFTTKEKLRAILPQESSVENPIDLLGDAREDRYVNVLKILNKESAGSIICILTPQDQTPVKKIAENIVDFRNKSKKQILTVFVGGERIAYAVRKLEEHGVPNFSFPEQAIGTLDKYLSWEEYRKDKKTVFEIKNIFSRKRKDAERIIRKAAAEKRNALFFEEAEQVMGLYGIKAVATRILEKEKDFDGVDYPVVIKVDSDKVLHKTDRQALILGIKNKEELVESFKNIKNNFPGERIIIQPMQAGNQELIMGIKRDSTVNSTVIFGLGGIYTEIFKKISFVIPPANKDEIEKIILTSPIAFLFRQTRGEKIADLNEFVKIVSGLLKIAEENPEIKELDINPLFVYNDKRKFLAADIKIII